MPKPLAFKNLKSLFVLKLLFVLSILSIFPYPSVAEAAAESSPVRYVRLTAGSSQSTAGKNFPSELKVFDENGTNVATGKHANWTDTNGNTGTSAAYGNSNFLDNRTTDYYHNTDINIASTLDLGQVYNIKEVGLWFISNFQNDHGRTADVLLEVSEDNTTWRTLYDVNGNASNTDYYGGPEFDGVKYASMTVDDDYSSAASKAGMSFNIDHTAPDATLTSGSYNNTSSVNVQSSEVGTAYLVKDTVTVSSLADITGASDSQQNSVAITTVHTDTSLSLTGLEEGDYKLYTADEAGALFVDDTDREITATPRANNLSSATTNSITIDNTAPVITLAGNATETVEYGTGFTDPGSTVTDNNDTGLTATVTGDTDINATTPLGTYTINYNVTDSVGNIATQVTRTVNVVDTTAPVITLAGNATETVEYGTGFTDPGSTVTDNHDTGLTATVTGDTDINATTPLGTYTINYNVTDSVGNIATQVTRTVTVVDTTVPVITLAGNATETVEYGTGFTDPGSTVTDNRDTGLTATVTGDTDINTTTPLGTYTINYNVTDSAGNTAQVTRTITVTAKPLTITGLTGTNKEYDGTTTASVSGGSLNGIVNSDDVSLDSSNATHTFANASRGTGIAITSTGYTLSGAKAPNYVLTQPTGVTADIVDTTPPVISTSSVSSAIDENTSALGSVSVNETSTWSVTGSGISIDPTTGVLTLDSPADYETATSHSFTVTATDDHGNSSTSATITVAVNNLVDTALEEVVEDIAGNTNSTPATATQLNSITGVSGAITGTDYSTALAAGTYADPANPTAAEIQAVVDAENASNAGLAAVAEDIAGNADATPATATEINAITGVSGAITGTDYSTALAAGTYADPANPTAAEIQAVVDAENTLNASNAGLAAVAEDIAGNADATPATATEINAITGVSGAITGTDYSAALAAGTYADPANPTAAEIQAVVDAENASNAGLTAVAEDIAGNADGTPATATEINAITGVSGAVTGTDYSAALAAGTYADPANPTATEIQAVVDAENTLNASNAGLAAVAEDIAGNADATPATATEINAITGVSGAITGTDYSTALAAGTYADPANPTAAEIQAVVDAENAANASNAGLAAVAEDIAGNADATPATATEINAITGVSGAITGTDYSTALAAGTYADPANPTAAEIQAVVDAENTSNAGLAAVAEDIAGNADATPATATEINSITGVSGAITGTDYSTALAAGTYADPANPTAAEIQAVVDAENASNAGLTAVAEDIAGNADGTPATATEINAITGVSGAVTGTDYSAALAAGTYADPANPTAAEIQAVVDAENAAYQASDSDGDGLTVAQEILLGTDPDLADTAADGGSNDAQSDNDSDQVDNLIEINAPNEGDANGDGSVDALQNHVASLPNTVVGGNPYNSIETLESGTSNACALINAQSVAEASLTASDDENDYPYGLWDFSTNCANSIDVIIYLDQTYNTSAWIYRKFSSTTNTYTDISSYVTYGTSLVGSNTVTTISYTVVDNGPLDEDPAVGVIRDPSGPSTPSISSSGGGGSQIRTVAYLCDEETGECSNVYPRAGTTGYQEFLSCRNGGASGKTATECAVEWGGKNGYREEETLSAVVAGQEYSSAITEVGSVLEAQPENQAVQLDKTSCTSVTYERFPENRSRGVNPAKFNDTEKSHEAYAYLIDLAEQRIIEGDENTRFAKLDREINRAEVAKIMTIARQDTIKIGDCQREETFVDIVDGSWFYDFAKNMKVQGIVHGYEDGSFRPARTVQKAEAYKILALGLGLLSKEQADIEQFSKPDQLWYEPYQNAIETQLALPDSIVEASLDRLLTRGEFFTMLSVGLQTIDK